MNHSQMMGYFAGYMQKQAGVEQAFVDKKQVEKGEKAEKGSQALTALMKHNREVKTGK